MEIAKDLFIAVLPALLIIGVFWFFRKDTNQLGNYRAECLKAMKAQNENLERIAKALEQKNGTDVK
ncbi:MAG: hypothetical protein KA099_07060 [Alphaproteobacteria bacterium]|nr:hypothetical protein [Alphaproteobacteria bacterium]MBP7760084.1 hypothetical protein [Alphaproteobacteria bacterium]MBP7762880.1 hypothetical protein [Alphaproteobacteria bacterium]MBP7905069.1 hypothetical protein [Alphaproteobacteria bacterium]